MSPLCPTAQSAETIFEIGWFFWDWNKFFKSKGVVFLRTDLACYSAIRQD